MRSRSFSVSISAGLLWTMVVAFSLATYRFSESWTQSVFAGGCCAVAIGLLQQVTWLRGLRALGICRNTLRLAVVWRIFVVVAMAWSFVILAASHYGFLPEGLHGRFENEFNTWFGAQQLAVAGLAVGCLCGVMTAPWLRLNRLESAPVTIRGVCYATIAGIPLVLNTAFECGAVTGLVDIATQGVLIGTLEPATVSSGALPTDISRGNALNSLFVERSIRAWCGVATALLLVSIVARFATRPRVRFYSCLSALILAIPAILLIHWLAIDGYRRGAPHLWLTHHWPQWQIMSLAILPLSAVTVLLSIKRQGIELPTQDPRLRFLSDSYITYLSFVAVPVLWIWELIRTSSDSGLMSLMGALTGGDIAGLVLILIAGEMTSPTGGMLVTALAAMCLGGIVSRWRYSANSPRSLTVLQAWQIPLLIVVSALVVLIALCTIPFGISLMHVGI